MNKGILIILDGYGEGKADKFNAVKNAKTPVLDSLKNNSYSLLKTDGEAVGLFKGAMGGSEVGHMTIGAGRVVKSTAKKIYDDIVLNKFKNNQVFKSVLTKLKQNQADLHLIGMISDKNVHSDINHLFHIIELAKTKAKNIYLHLITDGRDSGVTDSIKYLKQVQKFVQKNVHIASISGRFYAMDRENNFDRTTLAFDAMFKPKEIIDIDVIEYVKSQHKQKIYDEYILPTHFKCKYKDINQNDIVFVFNFREDRIRQICSLIQKSNYNLVTMAEVGNCNNSLYKKEKVDLTLSEYLSKNNLSQIKISESTKYAHVTYYLNGGRETPFIKEDRIHVPTKKVDNFSKTPKMQAKAITKHSLTAISKGYDAIIVNYSNADMLGHTGNYKATKKGIEYVDKCLNKILKLAQINNYFVLVTADHGNSECMQKNGVVNTSHTTNRVFCAVKSNKNITLKKYGELKDVAPTFIDLMGLDKNPAFEGESLII